MDLSAVSEAVARIDRFYLRLSLFDVPRQPKVRPINIHFTPEL